jgi:hypothetical protein
VTSFPLHIKAADDRFAEIKKERDIRDLKQQAKGIEDFIEPFHRNVIYQQGLDKAFQLRSEAKALKEQE